MPASRNVLHFAQSVCRATTRRLRWNEGEQPNNASTKYSEASFRADRLERCASLAALLDRIFGQSERGVEPPKTALQCTRSSARSTDAATDMSHHLKAPGLPLGADGAA